MMNEVLINVLTTIIVGVISILSAFIVKYVNKLIEKAKDELQNIKDEGTRNLAQGALDTLNSIIYTNVVSAETTLKKEMISASEDGKLTKEDYNKLKEAVVDNIIIQVSNDVLDAANKELDDVDEYIKVKIEEVLAQIKGQI